MRVLLIGPQGCGKTINSYKIADFFGVSNVFDSFAGTSYNTKIDQLRPDGLFICNAIPRGLKRSDFDIVIEVNDDINKLALNKGN